MFEDMAVEHVRHVRIGLERDLLMSRTVSSGLTMTVLPSRIESPRLPDRQPAEGTAPHTGGCLPLPDGALCIIRAECNSGTWGLGRPRGIVPWLFAGDLQLSQTSGRRWSTGFLP